MYGEHLEKLINHAIVDGELTQKERQVLIKHAQSEGINLDEFEMVIEAKLFEKQKTINTAAQSVITPKSDKFGDVKKCPACGAIVENFSLKCTDCGTEFRNIEATTSTQRLYKELMRVEQEERDRKVNFYLSLFQEVELPKKIWFRKSSVITSFPVPNTKADILEFLSLAVSEGGKKITFFNYPLGMFREEKLYIKSWRSKAEQVIIKARFSLKDDNILLEEINKYAKMLRIK